MRCPICKKEVAWNDPNMPFCSDRCRTVDLGNWATEKYAIPGTRSNDLDEIEETEFVPDPETDPHIEPEP